MNFEQLRLLIKAASKIFVWVKLSEERAAYFQTTKSAVNEYLSSIDPAFEEKVYIEIGEEGELYLGRAPTS